MRRQCRAPSRFALAAVMIALICLASAVTSSAGELQITNDASIQDTPNTWGDYVVWADHRHGLWDNIYMYNLLTGVETRLTDQPGRGPTPISGEISWWGENYVFQNSPQIDGDKVVWFDARNGNYDIYMYDISSGVESAVTTNPATQVDPFIDGTKIIWEDYRNATDTVPDCDVFKLGCQEHNSDVYMYDLVTGVETQITSNTAPQRRPEMDGNYIVWHDGRHASALDSTTTEPFGIDTDYEIYMYDISTGVEKRITSEPHNQRNPLISGDRIVWMDSRNATSGAAQANWDVYMYDISDATETALVTRTNRQWRPAIWGNYIVYEDALGSGQWALLLHDLATGTETTLTSGPGRKERPYIEGNRVVWSGADSNGIWDIYFYEITGSDSTPPTTYLQTIPLTPNGQNQWFKTIPTVSLSRSDPGTTFYQWDSTTTTWTTYSGSFSALEGRHTLYYYSVDTAGNTETVNPQVMKVNTTPWQQVSPDGLGTVNNVATVPTVIFNSYLYAGTGGNITGGQIWRTQDGTNWQPVITGGWAGNPNNDGTWAWRLASGGYLFGATDNPTDGAQIWRSSDGLTWSQASSFIDPPAGAYVDVAFGGYLYAGSWGTAPARAWRSGDNGDTWTEVVGDGFGETSTVAITTGDVFGGYYYVGTPNPVSGGALWRTANGISWSEVPVGFDKSKYKVTSLVRAANGYLYVGTDRANDGSGGELWRSADGTNWTRVVENGFGNANNGIAGSDGLIVFENYLYVSTRNTATGAEIWKSPDGLTWAPEMTGGFGDANNGMARHLQIFGGKLYIGTVNNVIGGQIWALAGTDTTTPSAPTLAGFAPSNSRVDLYWAGSTDNVGVAGYEIYNTSDTLVATSTATSRSFSGLTPATTYGYYVKAYDAAGNRSQQSNVVRITTGAGGSTSAGSTVASETVSPVANVSLIFSDVTVDGVTTVVETSTAPGSEPPGFKFQPGLVYEVTTTASFTGPIYVSFKYDEAALTVSESTLRLFHYEGGVWVDVTYSLDTVNNVITGKVTSLSPFGVGGGGVSTGVNQAWLLVIALLMLAGGGRLLRPRRRAPAGV